MSRLSTLCAFLGLVLAGCTMIPEHKPPALPVVDQWPSENLSRQGEAAASAIGWRAFFLSEPLQNALAAALANNRDLRIAVLNVEAVRALYRIERAEQWPHVSAGADALRQNLTEAQNGGSEAIVSEYSADVGVAGFELDLFGRLRSRNAAALEAFFATEAAQEAARISLVAEVANAYLQWLADRKLLELTGETLSAQEKSMALIARRYEQGVSSKLDLVQVRTAVEAAKANQALYRRRVAQDRNALQLLMGAAFEPDAHASMTLDGIEVMSDLPVGLPSEVLLLRPDVRQAEHELLSANANIGAARAAFLPRISLTGSFGYASDSLSNLFSGAAAGAWRFVPQITAPLFQGGRLRAELEFAETQKEIAVARYERAIQSAFREVADELAARRNLDDELTAQRRQVEAARETYDLSYARYKAGVDSFLTVLDAQRNQFAAQQRQIEIERLRLANLVNLFKALGGGR